MYTSAQVSAMTGFHGPERTLFGTLWPQGQMPQLEDFPQLSMELAPCPQRFEPVNTLALTPPS